MQFHHGRKLNCFTILHQHLICNERFYIYIYIYIYILPQGKFDCFPGHSSVVGMLGIFWLLLIDRLLSSIVFYSSAGLLLIGVGAYIQINAKTYLDFLADNYLNTPIFIIIAGRSAEIISVPEPARASPGHFCRSRLEGPTQLFSSFVPT